MSSGMEYVLFGETETSEMSILGMVNSFAKNKPWIAFERYFEDKYRSQS